MISLFSMFIVLGISSHWQNSSGNVKNLTIEKKSSVFDWAINVVSAVINWTPAASTHWLSSSRVTFLKTFSKNGHSSSSFSEAGMPDNWSSEKVSQPQSDDEAWVWNGAETGPGWPTTKRKGDGAETAPAQLTSPMALRQRSLWCKIDAWRRESAEAKTN